MIAPGHAVVAEHELREKRQEETDEDYDGRQLRPPFRIEAAGDLGPPVVQAAHVPHDHAADHDEMEMGDHEIGIVDVHVHAESGEEQAG